MNIPIDLGNGLQITIQIFSESEKFKPIRISDDEAERFGEAPIQIMEGCSYEYSLSDGYSLATIPGVVTRLHVNNSAGRILPGVFTGLLSIPILKNDVECSCLRLEVQSVKASYREDYRVMLEEIAEECSDLVMQCASPVTQFFTQDYSLNSRTLYQQFSFVRTLIDSPEFFNALNRIISSPVKRWENCEKIVDIRGIMLPENWTNLG